MDVQGQIRSYLEKPEVLYEEWHLKQVQHETGVHEGKLRGKLGSLADHKKAFASWLRRNREQLKQAICPNRERIEDMKQPVDIVAAIMCLIQDLAFVGGALEAAGLLFLYGIGKLCKDDERSAT